MTKDNMVKRVAAAISGAAYDYMRSIGFSGGWDHDELGRTIAEAAIATMHGSDSGATEEMQGWNWLVDYAYQRWNEQPEDRTYSADQMVDAYLAGSDAVSSASAPDSGALREALAEAQTEIGMLKAEIRRRPKCQASPSVDKLREVLVEARKYLSDSRLPLTQRRIDLIAKIDTALNTEAR